MNELLSGLDKFGFKDVQNLKIFGEKSNLEDNYKSAIPARFEINEVTYEKEFKCDVCRNKFKSRVMRLGRMQHVAIDYDLRPIYKEPIHPIFYDIHICPNCGYAAITQMFSHLNSVEIKLVQDNITPKFKYVEYPAQLDVKMAIERYKFTLLNAVIRNAKDSEKAYLCMRIAWLYRSIKDKKNELAFIAHAYKGFCSSIQYEHFPVFGMDENVVSFVAASYAKTLGFLDDALKLLTPVVVSQRINTRLKDRAQDLKHEIMLEKKKNNSEQS